MADTGWVIAGTGASVGWNNPGNITADDGSGADRELGSEEGTPNLHASNFDFATAGLTSGDTINGIEARVQAYCTTGSETQDNYIRLHKSETASGDNKAASQFLTTSYADYDYGGASDTWNSGYDADDLLDSGFGLQMGFYNTTKNTNTVYVDAVWIKVHYTTPSAGNVGSAGPVAWASVKSMDGVVKASVKTADGVAAQ
jgi:hypothetical protein